jgi:hypothetical protein
VGTALLEHDMRLIPYALIFSFLSATALAADSNRIIALEQDVRNLERIVGNLEREVRELRRGGTQPAMSSSVRPTQSDRAASDWVSASKWKQLRLKMSELEVIEMLGAPTSMRNEGNSRLLLYAMEIGATGFLSGSVRLRDGEVVEVQAPTLK